MMMNRTNFKASLEDLAWCINYISHDHMGDVIVNSDGTIKLPKKVVRDFLKELSFVLMMKDYTKVNLSKEKRLMQTEPDLKAIRGFYCYKQGE